MPTVALTKGRLTALWFVLRCLERLGGEASTAELIKYASRSSLRIGALPIRDGVRLSGEGGFVRERLDQLEITGTGRIALALGVEDEPSSEARRFFVSVLLLSHPPPWVAYWQGDPESLDLVVPEAERRILVESGLLPPPMAEQDLGSWAFWQALGRVPLVAEAAAQRKVIGDAGEELSLAHEHSRLRDEGFPELALQVQWLSRESDAYGFDILSFMGRQGPTASERLAIEVKSSSLPRGSWFHFFLSSHEWDTAAQLGDKYIIHVWTRVDPGPPAIAREGGPVVLQSSELIEHLPGPAQCGKRCQWESAEIYWRSTA